MNTFRMGAFRTAMTSPNGGMTSAGPSERRLDDKSPSKRRLKRGALRGGCRAVGGIFGPLKCGDTSARDWAWDRSGRASSSARVPGATAGTAAQVGPSV